MTVLKYLSKCAHRRNNVYCPTDGCVDKVSEINLWAACASAASRTLHGNVKLHIANCTAIGRKAGTMHVLGTILDFPFGEYSTENT